MSVKYARLFILSYTDANPEKMFHSKLASERDYDSATN